MSYYDPLAPGFEATRLQIQRTIMGLEQRLLRRKELDLQIQKDLIEQETLQKLRKQSSFYRPLNQGYGMDLQLQQRLLNLRTFNPRQGPKNYADHQPHKQALQLDYIARLREVQRQQSLSAQQLLYNNKATATKLYDDNYYPFDESGQMLARKYFDGTRAYQYNEELQKSGDKYSHFDRAKDFVKEKNKKKLGQSFGRGHHQSEAYHSTVKKYEGSSLKYNDQYQSGPKSLNTNQSPIKQIQNSSRLNSTAGKIVNIQRQRQMGQILKQQQQKFINDNSAQLQSKKMHRARTKSTQPTTQLINLPESIHFKQLESNSRQKSAYKNSQCLSNRHKSSKTLQYHSGSKSSLPNVTHKLQIQQKFKIWFRDRMKMAEESKQILEIFYAKSLSEYLLTVCQKEDQLRKELKEKIMKFPSVERKYDVGSVNE